MPGKNPMTGRLAALACLALLAAAAGGCAVADTGAFGRLSDEVEGLKKEVRALKAAPPQSPAPPPPAAVPAAGGREDVSALQQRLADLAVDVDKLKSDTLASTSQADDAKLKLQKEVADLNSRTDEQAQSLAALKAKNAALDDIGKRLAALEQKVDRLGAARGAAPPPVPPPAAQEQSWKSPEEMYEYALGLIRRGESRKGREVLDAFVGKYPDHKLMPNALYWRGESFYSEKDYDGAILAFQDVVDKYPSSDKAPDAMYKQGLSFLALSDTKNAKLLFELVQTKYPKSSVAELAKQKASQTK